MNNLRFALRQLAKAPGFTAVAVLIFALGIGGNTVVFSLVNGLFLRPLPFPDSERLVDIDQAAPKWNLRYAGIDYGNFAAWREHNETFAAMAHLRGGEYSIAIEGRSARVPGQTVTHDMADVLGIRPVVGRMFSADEELRGTSNVAVVGYHIWDEWFQRDPAIVGKTIKIDAESYEIIGVLPATAVVPSRAALWLPFKAPPPNYGGLAIGRLKPGVTVAQANADLLRIHRARIPEAKENEVTSPIVQPLLQRHLGGAGFIAFVLQSAVVVLLLIACANIAGLMLARTLTRVPELGLRSALGASPGQLVRLIMTETLVLAAIGGAVGVLLGRWALELVVANAPDLPAWIQLTMDWRFILFVSAAVVLCAVFAGLVPARHALRRLDLRGVIGASASQVTSSGRRVVSMRVLVVCEIALALVLLLVAGLFGRAFERVITTDSGIRPERVLSYELLLPEASYRSNAARLAFFDEHLARVRALPQVESASASTVLPFSGQHVGNFFEPEGGLPGGPNAKHPVVLTRKSYPGYFDALGISLTAGRAFNEQDRRDVIIVNESLARLFWPGENPVGKRMRSVGSRGAWLHVVGVARDIRHYGLEGDIRPGVYVPFHAMPQSSVWMVVRTKGDPANVAPIIRALLKEQDPTFSPAVLATMEERIRQSLFLRRMYSGMTAIFALIAVAMAMSGLYGIVAYVVGQRTREFGIRLAMGAQVSDVLRLVIQEGARLGAVGLGLGLVGGVLAGMGISALLAGVSPLDPLALGGATVLLASIVIAACLVPARRATRLNVLEVLRAE